jgi:rubrerythrin
MDKTELAQLLKEYVEFEKLIASKAAKRAEKIQNLVLRELLRGIALDSQKHAKILEAAIGLIEGEIPTLSTDDLQNTLAILRDHQNMEEKAIQTYEEQITAQKGDRRLQLIFQFLLSDERQHHALLKQMIQVLDQSAAPDEEAIWELFAHYSQLAELVLEQMPSDE